MKREIILETRDEKMQNVGFCYECFSQGELVKAQDISIEYEIDKVTGRPLRIIGVSKGCLCGIHLANRDRHMLKVVCLDKDKKEKKDK